MLHNYIEMQIKSEVRLNHKRKVYSLFSGKKEIGSMTETLYSSKKIGNRLLRFVNFFHVASLELELLDMKKNRIGRIRKEKGFSKNLLIFTKNEGHIATIKPMIKSKLPSISVFDAKGTELIRAEGNYGATDFSVVDSRFNRQISYVKRRSLEKEGLKDQLLSPGEYYNIHNNQQEKRVAFALVAICIAMDIYFDN